MADVFYAIRHLSIRTVNFIIFGISQLIEGSLYPKEKVSVDNKTKHPKIILSLGVGILILIACNFLEETIPLVEKTAVPVIENTAVPFKPGDPTATPLGSDITDPNFIKGVEAFYDRDYEGTISLMSAVIKTNPSLAPPYRYRGGALALLGDCTAGLADAEKAISLVPDYAAAWAIRGLSYGCLGNERQQLKDYEKALSIDPSLAFVHHNLGYYYYLQGNYEKSLEEYDLAVAIDPNRSYTWSSMGEVKSLLGMYDECIIYATRALDINKEEWAAYSVRAVCEQFDGDAQAAIPDYKIYLEHYPLNAPIWSNLGNAQRDVKLFEDALVSHNRALELDSFYYQANINRGLVYKDLGEYDEALNDFNRALEFGNIPAAYSGRGTTYYFLGQYDEAIADLEYARDMMPYRPTSYCFLALSYFEVGRYQDALDSATQFDQLELECGGQRLLEIRARAYNALEDHEQAIIYINKALEMGEYKLGYYYRGIIYHDAGKNAEAILDLKRFLSLEPDVAYEVEITDAKERLSELEP